MITTPTGVLLGSAAPNTEAWHELRAAGIGASEVAAVLGLSPWASPYSLWWAKREGWRTDETPEMHWGTALEPVIRREFADRHNLDIVVPGTYRHRDRDWQRCNPDGLVIEYVLDGGDGEPQRWLPTAAEGLEVKTARYGDDWGPDGSDQIPIYYRTQVVWCMDTLGLPRWHVAVLIAGSDYREYVVEYDPEEAAFIRERVAAFWQSLVDDVPPDLDGSTATLQTVRKLHPDIDGTDVTCPAHVADEWWTARADLAAAQERERLATAELLAGMGTARRAVLDDGTPVARRQPGARGSVSLYSLAPKPAKTHVMKESA